MAKMDAGQLVPVFIGAGAKEIVQETVSGILPVGTVSPNILTGIVGLWGASAVKGEGFWHNFLLGVAIASFAEILGVPISNFWKGTGLGAIAGGATTTTTKTGVVGTPTADAVGAYLSQTYGVAV